MPLIVHRAERTDRLADALGDLLAEPLEDPFAEELVVVPARGVERWLTQRLSHRLGVGPRGGDGVCAGVRFVTPHSLVSTLLDRGREDPWDPDQLVWPLLGVIDEAVGEPGFEALSRHLGHGGRPGDDLRRSRRWSVARRLAGLFASYAVQRPRLVADWLDGRPTDGCGGELDADLAWQPEMWRRLVAVQRDSGIAPPPERHAAALASPGPGGQGLDLPPRLSLFGHTRLPETEVELLQALAQRRAVHLWLPQVSAALWDDLEPTARAGRVVRDADDSVTRVGHPLLASLGRDTRELRRSLGEVDHEEPDPAPPPPDTLLGWLQGDLRANREPDEATRATRVPQPGDASVQVHACHGPARQVDVLREVLVGLLEDDPTLEPRDILVMCPDIEGYAPLVSAGFGLADLDAENLLDGAAAGREPAGVPRPAPHPAHRLRVQLADRSPGATNPLLVVAATLVELAPGRLTADEVLDLAATTPVRRRFGLDDDDLDRLRAWVESAAIRWGLDADHRAGWGLSLDANTWARGLRRVLLGSAVSGDGHRVVADVLPLDDVGDGDLELVGTVVELVDRLHAFVAAASAAGDGAAWAAALRAALAGLTATPPADAWQAAQVERELAVLTDERPAGRTPGRERQDAAPDGRAALRHADVRALLRRRLRGRPTRANFRTGTLTVCTMVPMRSVPHRVVCLVGLDDDVFPRSPTPDGDDVLARRPRTGERDARAEDRQLLLDAVGAATETLVVTYTGCGVHTGLPRPPAVPLGELLDALGRTATGPGGSDVLRSVVRRHPLQPHDEAAMRPGALGHDEPFTFDAAAVAGAEAARSPARAEPRLVPNPLPALPAGDVALADLHDFLAHPVRAFLRGRLRVSTGREHEELGAGVPIELDNLETWQVGDRLLRDVLDGASPQAGMRAEQLRGMLPPGRLGVRVLEGVKNDVRGLVERAEPLRRGEPRTLDVDVPLRDGRRLTGTVSDLYSNALVRVSFSRLGAKHRLAAWLDALALGAGHPDEAFTAHTVGRHRSGAQRALLPPLDHRAAAWLSDLVEVWDAAMTEPAPLPVKTGLAWAEEWCLAREGRQADPDGKAEKEWRTPRFNDSGFPREDDDAWHALAFGERAPYERLAAEVRAGDPGREPAGSGFPDPPHRLGRFAWAVWGPLLTESGEQVRAL